MFITFLKKLGKILGRGLLVLAVLFILYTLILSDGKKQVGLGLRPSAYYSIYFGHYEYTASNMVSYTELKRMFEKALNGYGSRR